MRCLRERRAPLVGVGCMCFRACMEWGQVEEERLKSDISPSDFGRRVTDRRCRCRCQCHCHCHYCFCYHSVTPGRFSNWAWVTSGQGDWGFGPTCIDCPMDTSAAESEGGSEAGDEVKTGKTTD
ncbi:unnamed protein product [Protopolystoma xenopodis]|uniref:Uncharacterized protein n=1 Tax=Protopolystoma xenopodis TaxID=117903 RepID=A0A448X8W0_9PLAT|nr:unnamed protein product [Protopolystoma xenopodis]